MSELLRIDYVKYAIENSFSQLLGIDLSKLDAIDKKRTSSPDLNVTDGLPDALPAELDDLVRLHFLIRKSKAITALEFGSGKSTIVIGDALERNKREHSSYVQGNLRKNNPFELYSVETSERWASEVLAQIPASQKDLVKVHLSQCQMTTIESRICTVYDNLPNICPDFIYLDGPDQYCPSGDIGGISTRHQDRLPMVGDLIRLEHFLLPGTIIVVDGRTANARFMLNNFQLPWRYRYFAEFDQHIFLNVSEALGLYNQRELEFKCVSQIESEIFG